MNASSRIRLGSYELLAPLGSGGMGEVYRARDTRLGREVAVKVMAHRLTGNPEALSRFRREAQAVAALSHPNILALFDYGESDGTVFAVMELLEGESLRARLASGPLPQRKAVEYAVQMARGLAAAHERGIIHRDLKPENVFLTRDGQVKVLDFGLARLAAAELDGGETAGPDPSPPTRPGIVMGTPGYMSPEQMRGQTIDPRSDIFAFGATFYEMLAGRRAFRGETAAEAMTAALREEPPDLSTSVPPALDRIVRHCLEKNREQRFQSARDLAFHLEAVLDPSTSGASKVPAARRRPIPAWVAWAAAAAGSVLGLAGWLAHPRGTPPAGASFRSTIVLPAELRLMDPWDGVAVSPDGRFIAFIAAQGYGEPKLWIRPLDSLEPRLLEGTEDARLPFWSPDSRSLGFFAVGKLKRAAVDGSAPPQVVCDAADGRGGTWSQNGDILFAPYNVGGLYRVPAAGGEPVQITHPGKGEDSHRFPTFLPGGRRFLYATLPLRGGHVETRVASLDDPRPRPLLRASSVATFVPGGHVVFARDQTVFAQRLDADSARLVGEPQPVGELSMTSSPLHGTPIITGASTGVLAFGSEPRWTSRLQWFEHSGTPGAATPVPAGYDFWSVSPDGRYAALHRVASPIQVDIWLLELASGMMTRLTHGPGQAQTPIWSPNSRRIAYTATSPQEGIVQFYLRELSNPDHAELLFASKVSVKRIWSWSQDSRFLFFHEQTPRSGLDIWALPLDGTRRPVPYLRTPFNEYCPGISPDGHWLAYSSDESGAFELYMQNFPKLGRKARVSTGGVGGRALWSPDSRQVSYFTPDFTMMVADIQTQPDFRVIPPRRLFQLPPTTVDVDRAADGRFLVQIKDFEVTSANITVIANWTSLLEPR